jgi:hypothetical protein
MEIVKQTFGGLELGFFEEEGELWAVASEVAKVLGYRNGPDMTRRLDDDEKGTRSVRTLGGVQEVTVINEPGIYRAIFASKKEEAQQFKRWLAHDLLPTLRRTGFYSMREPVCTIRMIAEAYGYQSRFVPMYLENHKIAPVGWAEHPDTGRGLELYRTADILSNFAAGTGHTLYPLRPYSGPWTVGPMPALGVPKKVRRLA